MLYDDTYTGERFIYGYRLRPFGIACQPDGFICGTYHPDARPADGIRHGTIAYPRRLTADEIEKWELVDLQPLRPTAPDRRAILAAAGFPDMVDAIDACRAAHLFADSTAAEMYLQDVAFDWPTMPRHMRATRLLEWVTAELRDMEA